MIRSEGSIKLLRAGEEVRFKTEKTLHLMRRSVEEVSSDIWIYNPYIY